MRNFDHTIGVLVNSYLKNTLVHHTCAACAVTNIIGHSGWSRFFVTIQNSNGTDIIQYKAQESEILVPSILCGARVVPLSEVCGDTLIEREAGFAAIVKSGYTIEELAKIEFAFETAARGNNEEEHMFNGLIAVVEQLADIHGIDIKLKEEAKALFVKH